MMKVFCAQCGAEANEGSRFCMNCGSLLENAVHIRELEEPEEKKTVPVNAPVVIEKRGETMSFGEYLGTLLLFCIPVVGFILAIVWACGGTAKINKRNLSRAALLVFVILLIIAVVLTVCLGILLYHLAVDYYYEHYEPFQNFNPFDGMYPFDETYPFGDFDAYEEVTNSGITLL